MPYRILLRRDLSQNWDYNDPVLMTGEPGYEIDTRKFKMGDGQTPWSQLPYYAGVTGATGSQGATGATGPTGAQGVTGPQGATGQQGQQGIQGVPGIQGTVGPAGLNWQGSWVSGTSYVEDDAVGYDGASWFCTLGTTGASAPNIDTTHWALLASQGAPGQQGEQGVPGVPGSVLPIIASSPLTGGTITTTGTIGIEDVSASQSGVVNTTSLQELGGVDKTINGVRVGRGNISDILSENTAIGYQALQSVTHATGFEGWYNSAFGDSALKALTTGYANNAFGEWALIACTIGTFNTAVGGSALSTLTIGTQNVAIGVNALRYNLSGNKNTAVGTGALYRNTGSFNTAIGNVAGGNATSSGSYNILVGFQAGRDITTGNNNLLIENITNASITTGSYNIILNPKQKSGVTTGSNNTIIGCWDGTFATGLTGNVILGNGSGSIRFQSTDTGLTTVPGQTNTLINGDATGKAVATKEYVNNRLVVETTSGYTLNDTDSGGIVIFKTTPTQTLTIPAGPTGLTAGFECTFVTLDGVTLTVPAAAGITLNNATSPTGGNVLPPQSSFTLKRMIATNTFIATGNL